MLENPLFISNQSHDCGVPQGSVLRLLMFLVYINDLVNSMSCNVKLFADDTVLYVISDDVNNSTNILNQNLTNVNEWADKWLVSFNPAKTKLMNITLKRNTNFDNYPIYFDNQQIETVNVHRHLGLEVSSDLKWTNHIDNIISSVSKISDVMMKLKYRLDRVTLQQIYVNFVRPKLEYAHIIWDDRCEYSKSKLDSVQCYL